MYIYIYICIYTTILVDMNGVTDTDSHGQYIPDVCQRIPTPGHFIGNGDANINGGIKGT